MGEFVGEKRKREQLHQHPKLRYKRIVKQRRKHIDDFVSPECIPSLLLFPVNSKLQQLPYIDYNLTRITLEEALLCAGVDVSSLPVCLSSRRKDIAFVRSAEARMVESNADALLPTINFRITVEIDLTRSLTKAELEEKIVQILSSPGKVVIQKQDTYERLQLFVDYSDDAKTRNQVFLTYSRSSIFSILGFTECRSRRDMFDCNRFLDVSVTTS